MVKEHDLAGYNAWYEGDSIFLEFTDPDGSLIGKYEFETDDARALSDAIMLAVMEQKF